MAEKKEAEITTEQTKNANSTFSKSEGSIENKDGKTTVSASKLVLGNQPEDGVTISTTVKTTTEGKRQSSSNLTNTLDKYDASLGYSQKTTTYTDEAQKDKKGRIRHETSGHIEQEEHQASAFATAHGYTETNSFGNTQVSERSYDKKGNMKTSEVHTTSYSRTRLAQKDEKAVYNNRGEVKRDMLASAENAHVTVAEIKGKKTLTASVNANGFAQYSESKKNSKGYQVTDIYVSPSGEVSGVKYTAEMRADVKGEMYADSENAQKKALSARASNRAYHRIQQKADKVVRKVSATADNLAEYRQQTANPSQTKSMPLNKYFERPDEATTAAVKEHTKSNAEKQTQAIAENKAVTTEMIVQQKLQEQRH